MAPNIFNNSTLQERRFALLLEEFTASAQVRIRKALKHAKELHEGQVRDEGIPYIIHPIRTVILLIEHGEREVDLLVAALLHDVVEDSGISLDDITMLYGNNVARLVKDATRPRSVNETDTIKRASKSQKFEWFIAEAPIDSCKIKAADVIDNMRSWQYIPEGHPTRKKFPRWCEEAQAFYPSLTKKAGEPYYQSYIDLFVQYQSMPQFRSYLPV